MLELDYYRQLEITVLFAVILFGSFGTISSGVKLWNRKKTYSKTVRNIENISAEFQMYQKSLNISDCLIIVFYVLRELLDMIQCRKWIGGSVMCKATHFLGTTGLYLSSNVIVCIGFYRAYCTMKCKNRLVSNHRNHPVFSIIMLSFAWICSICFSIPQMFLWDTVSMESENSTVIFCTTSWDSDANSTANHLIESFNIFLSLTISPIPCLLIVLSYAYVAVVLKFKTSHLQEVKFIRMPDSSRSSRSASYAQNIREWGSVVQEGNDSKLTKKVDSICNKKLIKVLRSSLVLLLVYTTCWLPYNVATLWSLIDIDSFYEYAHVFKFTWHFMSLSVVFNSWAYKIGNCNHN